MTQKKLKSLRVETVSGNRLGKVRDLDFDVDSQMIIHYEVTGMLPRSAKYMIHRDQVEKITEEKMVVYDTVTPIDDGEKKKKDVPAAPDAITMRE